MKTKSQLLTEIDLLKKEKPEGWMGQAKRMCNELARMSGVYEDTALGDFDDVVYHDQYRMNSGRRKQDGMDDRWHET